MQNSSLATNKSAKQRISDLDKLFSRIYEDNILGKLSDERYSRMASEYETEQKQLMQEVEENEKTLIELQKQTVDMKMLYQGLMGFTEMKELTPTVVNKLNECIEIHILTTMLKWIFTLQQSDCLTFRQNSSLLTQWKE